MKKRKMLKDEVAQRLLGQWTKEAAPTKTMGSTRFSAWLAVAGAAASPSSAEAPAACPISEEAIESRISD